MLFLLSFLRKQESISKNSGTSMPSCPARVSQLSLIRPVSPLTQPQKSLSRMCEIATSAFGLLAMTMATKSSLTE